TQHVITGFFPIALLQFGTEQAVKDKAKELIDILAPGGGFIFGFDKGLFTMNGNTVKNLHTLTDFVRDYGVYR
ncbi:MAG: uroporphyrinogen decarboxylase, partial [Eubacterium sp.]